MAFHFLLIFSLLNLAIAGNHAAALPEEVYWKSVFPNTKIPKALKDILPQPVGAYNYGPSRKEFRSSVNEDGTPNKGFRVAYYNYGASRKEFTNSVNDLGGSPNKEFRIAYYNYGASKNDLGSVNDFGNPDSTPDKEFRVLAYNYRASKKDFGSVNDFGNPFIIYENGAPKDFGSVNDFGNPFIIYENDAPNKELKGNKNSFGGNHGNTAINETLYFFQEDLRPGKMVNFPPLTKTRDMTKFLPHQVVDSIPFSNDKLPQILKHLSFESESREAKVMKETIKGCDRDVMDGEEMYCATSFESLVDSSVSKLGKNIQLLTTELSKETKNSVFTIDKGIQNMGEEEIVCHKMRYPYAVFLCHSIDKTAVYRVPLVGVDGTKAKALAICHKDTSSWDADHPAFFILKVKPGNVPICHFVVRDTVAWVRK